MLSHLYRGFGTARHDIDDTSVSRNDIQLGEVLGARFGQARTAVTVLALVLSAPHPLYQLVKSDIERSELVAALSFGTDRRERPEERNLNFALVEHVARAVSALLDTNLDTLGSLRELLHLCSHLFLGVGAETLRNLDIAAGDGDFHLTLLLENSGATTSRSMRRRKHPSRVFSLSSNYIVALLIISLWFR